MVRFVNVNLSERNNLNFVVEKGSFMCLPCRDIEEKNLFLQILTKVSPTRGDILVGKESILKCREKAYRSKLKEIGIVYSDYKFIEYKNVYENLKYYLELRNYKEKEIDETIDETLEFFSLSSKKHSEIGALSHEDKVVMGLARAMLTEPDYLVIDDAHVNTQEAVWEKVYTFLQKLSRMKTGVLYLSCDEKFIKENLKHMKTVVGGAL